MTAGTECLLLVHLLRHFLYLLEEGKLSDFNLSFIANWLGKKSKGCYCHAEEQARSLTVLYSNKLGERAYNKIAPMLWLPVAHQACKILTRRHLLAVSFSQASMIGGN